MSIKHLADGTKRYQSFEGLRTKEEQIKLHKVRILLAGCGAGSNIAPHIARAGLGTLGSIIISDPGSVDIRNIDRQFYTPDDLGKNKAIALANNIHKIEPNIQTKVVIEGITYQNVTKLVNKVDIIVEMVDVAHLELTFALHKEAQKQAKVLITGLDLGDNIITYVFDYRKKSQISLLQVLGLDHQIAVEDIRRLSPLAVAAQMVIGQQTRIFTSTAEALVFYNNTFFQDEGNFVELLSYLSPDMRGALNKMLNAEIEHIPQSDIAGALLGLTHAKIIKEIVFGNSVKIAPEAIRINLTSAIN